VLSSQPKSGKSIPGGVTFLPMSRAIPAGSILPHYDVTENMRIKAVRFGAREVTREEVREVMTKMYGTWKFLPDMG
jgi:hypothetical protein